MVQDPDSGGTLMYVHTLHNI